MNEVCAEWGGFVGKLPKFRPAAKYVAPMDCIVYLREDCSYRNLHLSASVSVLLHPTKDEAVGVKFKSVRFLVERFRAIAKTVGVDLEDGHVVELISLWEVACTVNGDELTERADRERQRKYAEQVAVLIKDAAAFDLGELPRAA